MYLFHNDYNQGCHPKVMEKMIAMQPVQMTSYGQDVCCEAAAEKIRKLCNNDALAVHFLVGGTQPDGDQRRAASSSGSPGSDHSPYQCP